MNNRRRFIALAPFAGAALLAACSKETPSTSSGPAPVPTPAPTPAPAADLPSIAVTPGTSATGTPPTAVSSANLPLLQETDPAAVGLGYVAVSSRVDGSKYKNHTSAQACSNCALFAGKAGETQGACPLFAGKQVAAAGWCSAYVKKAG